MDAHRFLSDVRLRLLGENEKILDHRFVKGAEEGRLSLDRLERFATQQYHIVSYDLRSLALMLSRSRYSDEAEFFYTLLVGDKEALQRLLNFSKELGLTEEDLARAEMLPRCAAYTNYLAWLACYANAGEQALALTVNLPVWGTCCRRLGAALKDRYGLRDLGFFELFSGPYDGIEESSSRVVERYLGVYASSMERCARLIQGYELMFWDGVYEGW